MRRLPPLTTLRAFEAAARYQSFRLAAGELGVTPTAISHQIRLLEEWLGQPLFERRTRQVGLTEAGLALFPVLQKGFDDAAAAIAAIRSRPPRATVTLSATAAFTARWLVPRIGRFQHAFPEIDLRLDASEGLANLDAGQADIAIRYGAGPYSGFLTDILFQDRFGVVASPALQISKSADLLGKTLLHFEWHRADACNPTWSLWSDLSGIALDENSHLRFSNESHAIQAAIAGQGAGLLSLVLVEAELRAGLLTQPFGPLLPALTYHILRPRRAAQDPHVAAVRQWLLDEANADS
jgi:LysR family glycine cleavage system transcriptional activator